MATPALDAHQAQPQQHPHPQRAAGWREWGGLGVLVLAVVLLAVDATVLALAVPALTADLGATSTQVLWIGDVYSLALAGLLVTMGNVADRIGRKRLLLLGTAAFGGASLLAALSPTPETLIAARLLLGVAGATLMPSTLSLIRSTFTAPRQRTLAIAIWSAGASGGAALGPLVGGALLEHFWWGSVFLINLPVVAVLLVGGAWLLAESKNPSPGPVDLRSVVLSLVGLVAAVYAVKHLAHEGPDAVVLLVGVVGALGLVSFVRRQRRLAHPLIDVELFRRPAFSGAVAVNFASVFPLAGLLFFFSQYLQLARGSSPLQAGLQETPLMLSAIGAIAVIGLVLPRLGAGRTAAVGLFAAAAGLVLLALAEGAPSYLWLALTLVPIGLGVGLSQTVAVDAVVSAVPSERAGAASSISETAYELATALGIAVLGSLLGVVYRAGLQLPAGTDPSVAAAAGDSLAGARAAGAEGAALEAAREAFVHAMQVTSLSAAALTAVAAVIAWRMVPARLSGAAH
ncbi:MFS transporter [Streptomyces sp. NP160]|uniref:MFS transporter n=1 Tax=Streptomyces sp. NP160 TaxID=2586637 RepID=UPI00111A5652|nr:MFS transporter [Streptomyces sp. NP160]TNM64100.1 MFS transporter [Streptomyces sp. NP160]